jgi:hypothetical protein
MHFYMHSYLHKTLFLQKVGVTDNWFGLGSIGSLGFTLDGRAGLVGH